MASLQRSPQESPGIPASDGRIKWLEICRFLCTIQVVGFHWLRACVKVGALGVAAGASFLMKYRDLGHGWKDTRFILVDSGHHGLSAVANNCIRVAFGLGWEFVNVLIFISGLSLAFTLSTKRVTPRWSTWLSVRLKRILIPYYVVCLPCLIVFLLTSHSSKQSSSAIISKLSEKLLSQVQGTTMEVIAGHMLLFDFSRGQGVMRFLAPAWWFIPAILTAYLALPLFLYVKKRLSNRWFLTISLLITIGSYFLSQVGFLVENAWYFVILHENFSFCSGIVIGSHLAHKGERARIEALLLKSRFLFLGLVCFLLGNALNWHGGLLYPLSAPIFTVGACILSLRAGLALEKVGILWPLFSQDSYNLYLTHQLFAYPLALFLSSYLSGFVSSLGLLLYMIFAVVFAFGLQKLLKTLTRKTGGSVSKTVTTTKALVVGQTG